MTLSRLIKRFAALDVLDAEVARVNEELRRHGSAAAYIESKRPSHEAVAEIAEKVSA